MDTHAVRSDPAKEPESDFAHFQNFMRRLVAVPRSEIQKRLEDEKRAKASASRVPAAARTDR